MRPYSLDLRERILAAVDHQDGSIRWIARIFRVSTSFIVRLLQRRRAAGTVAPKPHRGGRPPALGPGDLERLAALVRKQPDATLEQLKQQGGFQCSLKTLWYALDRLGLTVKKKSLHADQRGRSDVQTQREQFRQEVGTIEPKKLVFVDETGITTTMTPAYGRAPRGDRVVDSVPASWETVTVIAALKLDGAHAPLVFSGSTDTAVFQAYVDQVLVPELHKGDIVVFDNVKPHKAVGVAKSIEAAGRRVAAAAVQPGLHPDRGDVLEIQAGSPSSQSQDQGRAHDAVGQVLRRVTPKDSLGWFRHAGLCATPG